jgi:hypothetical protein
LAARVKSPGGQFQERTEVEMQSIDAARIVHDWAAKEGLMPMGPAAPAKSTEAELGLVGPASELAKEILRKRQISGILFSAVAHTVTVLTQKPKPSRKQLKLLPQLIGDVEIEYRQGAIRPIGGEPPKPHGSPPFRIRQVANERRYTCGSSISQGNCRDAGTLGALVRDVKGQLYGLSNNHITGGCSHAQHGLPILAPGVADVAPASCDPFTIGYHERALEMSIGIPDNADPTGNQDAAIFRINGEGVVSSFQGESYDTPAVASELADHQQVEKVGRSTGHTKGVVVGEAYGAVPIMYNIGVHEFQGRVYFRPLFIVVGKDGAFSDYGDSGSLVTAVDEDGTRTAVGLVVGGFTDKAAPGETTTLVLPLKPILERFEVDLVSGHNV